MALILTVSVELSAGLLAKIFVNYDSILLAFTARAIRLHTLWLLIQRINMFWSALFTWLNNWLISAIIAFLRMFVFQVIMIFSIPPLFGSEWIWLSTSWTEILSLIVTVSFIVANRRKYNYA